MNLASVNDTALAYTDVGQGRVLLCVHGFPLNRQLWQPQVAALAGVARVIAVDLRGHGDSLAAAPPYSMELFAADLNAFLDVLDIQQPVIFCGLSMGGYVAFAFYRQYAHRLAGLVLTATRAAADTPEMQLARQQTLAVVRQQGSAELLEGMLSRLLAPITYQKRPDLVNRVRQMMQANSLESVLGDLQALKERPDSTPTLSQIELPTLLLPGAEDPIVPLPEARAMQAAIRAAQLQVIPEAGHLPNLENPLEFNQAIRQFLSTFR